MNRLLRCLLPVLLAACSSSARPAGASDFDLQVADVQFLPDGDAKASPGVAAEVEIVTKAERPAWINDKHEASPIVPTAEKPHVRVGELRLAGRAEYLAFSADDDEVAEAGRNFVEKLRAAARAEAKRVGADFVVEVRNGATSKDWWEHRRSSRRGAMTPNEKRDACMRANDCKWLWATYQLYRRSPAKPVPPTAEDLLQAATPKNTKLIAQGALEVGEGKARPRGGVDFEAAFPLQIRRDHCYFAGVALATESFGEVTADVVVSLERPADYGLVATRYVYSVGGKGQDYGTPRTRLQDAWRRAATVDLGCFAEAKGVKQLVGITSKGTPPPSWDSKLRYAVYSRRMKPKEALDHHCGRCGRAEAMDSCLKKRGLTRRVCKKHW